MVVADGDCPCEWGGEEGKRGKCLLVGIPVRGGKFLFYSLNL